MRRILVLAAAAALLAGAGAAWSSQSNGDPLDYVAGGGTFGPGCFDGPDDTCFGRRDLSIDAHGGPHGQNAKGISYYGRNEPNAGTARARDVLCMRVEANVAVVGGTYLQPTAQGDELWGWTMRVEDNGPPGPGPRDRSGPTFVDPLANWPDGFPQACPALDESYFEGVGYLPLHSGDLIVHDGNS